MVHKYYKSKQQKKLKSKSLRMLIKKKNKKEEDRLRKTLWNTSGGVCIMICKTMIDSRKDLFIWSTLGHTIHCQVLLQRKDVFVYEVF